MVKRILSMVLTIIMVLILVPLYNAYAAPNPVSMTNYQMNNLYNHSFGVTHYFNNATKPTNNGPVYDNPNNDGDIGASGWYEDTIDKKSVVRPGEKKHAAFGFCVDLEKHNMLGAAIKGQLSAKSNIYYDNYKGDDDSGIPFISQYNRFGHMIGTNYGTWHSVSNWINNEVSIQVPCNARYLIFGGRGVRDGGFLNKNMDFNVNNVSGYIWDNTAPWVVSITNDVPHKSADEEKLTENAIPKDPFVYITMSENCNLYYMNVKLTDVDGNTAVVRLHNLCTSFINYDNGDVTYKFRIMTEEMKAAGISSHFVKVQLNSMTAMDTFGNVTNDTRNLSCNKRVDLKSAIIETGATPNTFVVKDAFGISKISKTFRYSNVNDSKDVLNVGGDIFVKDATTNTIAVTDLNSQLTITNYTSVTGVFDVKLEVWDLVKNYSCATKQMFLISNSEPVKFKLKNSSNPTFDFGAENFKDNVINAKTNMTLTTDINPSYLNGATIYYKWSQSSDSSILSQDISNGWLSLKFVNNSNETEKITIPVIHKTDGFISYLAPAYTKGYLYIKPMLDDDTTNTPELRTGSTALAENGSSTDGLFNLVDSKPVKGEFTNRGCNCTGQNCNEDAVSHYGAIRNHNKAIGFNVTENMSSLNSIKYFVKNSEGTCISQGSLIKNDLGQYDIPIDSIKGQTGSYTVTVALYSNKGDVTVQDIKVNIENPVVSISNIMYNQATQNLDFTVSYNKNSILDNKLEDVQLEISDRDTVEFKNVETGNSKLSLFSLTEGSVIAKDKWDAEIGTKSFIRTEFVSDEKNTERLKADFRASLTNMEKSGDAFIKLSGAKRVHIKYMTSNKVEVFNNNITVIKKSNIPPSINLVNGMENSYFTKNDSSTASAIKVQIVEPVVEMSKVHYMWADSAVASLINADGSIGGTALTVNNTIDFEPKDIPAVTGDVLYKSYYLIVYAENSAGKYAEKSFGPFYVLNNDINSKRFNITATDKALGDKQILVSVDDRLHMINELTKADKIKVIWQKEKTIISKIYDLSFVKEGISTNVSVVNVPYIELTDTENVGGTYKLTSIELYNSADEKNILKSISPVSITQKLPEYFVKINGLSDSEGTYAVNVQSDMDTISYQWSMNPYEVPMSWITTGGAISGINFVPETKLSMINRSIYLFVKSHDNIYRSEKIDLKTSATIEPINVTSVNSVNLGEMTGGYFGSENGTKNYVPIRISMKSKDDLNRIAKVEVYDQFSVTSGTAITLSNLYKISETEMAGLIPSLVTSNSAIKCNVSVNETNLGYVTSENKGVETKELNFEKSNRVISLADSSDASKCKLYQVNGKSYIFDINGKTEIYTDGNYMLVYDDGTKFYAREIPVSGILYGDEDITTTFNPEKPIEGKISGSVTATITMPYGSLINDSYGVITNIASSENKIVATAVVTRSAIYAFDVQFANNQKIKYCVDLSFIAENYKPVISTVTSSAAIAYTPVGPALTRDNVTATLNLEGLNLLSNNYVNSYVFEKNGNYSLIAKDAAGNLYEYVSAVNWIDKSCPEPTLKKYVWNDYDKNGVYDSGEKGYEIPKGYKTKYDVIAEISFPHNSEADRPVQLIGADGFIAEDLSSISGYAYKYVKAYKPSSVTDNVYRKALKFTDTLANSLDYNLVIDEIDKTQLLTLLNYSTTEFTNRDVIVSMSANRPIKRYDLVEVTNESGIKETIEKDASPTYVFKQNGEKDFNYRQIEVVPGEETQGSLKAVVTWIDKSVPQVITEYSKDVTNKPVEIKFTIKKGVEQNAKLRYGLDFIKLTDSGEDRIGTYTVNDNGNYSFEVINKYGTIGDIIIPVNSIDKTAPELNIYGRDHVYIKVNDRYYDKGAYAFDNRDGDISAGIQVSSNVNTSLVTKGAPYEIVYTITDKSGNTSTKTRYVHVLDVKSAIAIINDNVIDLNSSAVHDIQLMDLGQVYVEFIGVEGSYTVKYAKGEGFDNAYFKTNGSYISKYGTFIAQDGKYVLHIQDQERNTRMITLNFKK